MNSTNIEMSDHNQVSIHFSFYFSINFIFLELFVGQFMGKIGSSIWGIWCFSAWHRWSRTHEGNDCFFLLFSLLISVFRWEKLRTLSILSIWALVLFQHNRFLPMAWFMAIMIAIWSLCRASVPTSLIRELSMFGFCWTQVVI